ncbi:hypothetical protein NDN08_007980 [Rhodosorus marinus]|uniref:Uncharacterized protein n=1 Tax=Rhodosorus marinus TaxID=101924 RepID=A0AAV8V1W8_9RHOD|nr:hypothetical protein NDN08_007980 [Rhodosorus marinus]
MVVGVDEIGRPATERRSNPAGPRNGIGNDSIGQNLATSVPTLLQGEKMHLFFLFNLREVCWCEEADLALVVLGLSPDPSYGSVEERKDVDFQEENGNGARTQMESVVASIAQTRALINSSQVFNRETKEEIKSWQARNMEITARNKSLLQEIHATQSQRAEREKRLEAKEQHLVALRNEIQDRTMSAKQFSISLARAKQAFDSQVLLTEKELTDATGEVENLEKKCHFMLELKRLVRARKEKVQSEKGEVEVALVKVEESFKAVEDDTKQLERELEKLNSNRRDELAKVDDLKRKQKKLAEEKDQLMKGVDK